MFIRSTPRLRVLNRHQNIKKYRLTAHCRDWSGARSEPNSDPCKRLSSRCGGGLHRAGCCSISYWRCWESYFGVSSAILDVVFVGIKEPLLQDQETRKRIKLFRKIGIALQFLESVLKSGDISAIPSHSTVDYVPPILRLLEFNPASNTLGTKNILPLSKTP